jgi:hypothetical protein
MFKTEIREALRAAHDRPQRRRGTSQHSPSAQDDSRDGATADEGGAADPDDVIDPDDLTATKPIRCAFLLPPSAKPETWWTALVLGRENDVVASQDAVLTLAHVAYRLGYARTDTGLFHNDITIGGLHEAIEEMFGSAGWIALMECWQAAAGIKQPDRNATRSRADITDRIPAQPKDHGKPSAESLVPLPSSACLFEEGLLQALPQMPQRVAVFFLHSPQPEPVWRYRESESERSQREQAEAEGAWAG